MNKKLLALYSLKFNPFLPEIPVSALFVTAAIESFCWRMQNQVGEGETIPEDILDLVRQRDEARENKDWSKADQLRDAVADRGFVIEDRPGGAAVRRKDS